VNIDGIQIPIDTHISEIIRKAMYLGEYENNEMKAIKSHLLPNDIVMELGTGIGFISSYCAKTVGSERVFTYEANPRLEIPIKETYRLNNISPQLEICILGEEEGEQTFYIGKNFWSCSTIPCDEETTTVQVKVKSFNREIQKINPNFLIIDIEGGEYELFKYADLYQVQKIMIEVHPQAIGEDKANFVKQKITDSGFQLNKKRSKLSGHVEELFWERQ
jgi:FkbM family methyltransferase